MAEQSEMDEIERREGFERTEVEDIINDFFTRKVGGPFSILESSVPGVIALERPDSYDTRKFHWDELAAEIARKTGLGVNSIVHCDWQNVDDADSEAVYIAVEIPSLPKDYRDDEWRNQITARSPVDVPTPEDFAARDRALLFAEAHLEELRARRKYATEAEIVGIDRHIEFLRNVQGLQADDKAVVQALLDRDVEAAIEASQPEGQAPTP